MGLNGDFSSPSSDLSSPTSTFGASPAMMASLYLWDACKKGKLFQTNTYQQQLLLGFVENFTYNVIQNTTIPSRFNEKRVYEKWFSAMTGSLQESDLTKSVDSVDAKKPETIEEFASESKDKTEKQMFDIIEFLKDDIFPQTLWIEYSRTKDSFSEAMGILIERLEKMCSFKPKRKDSIKRSNRFVQNLFSSFIPLANDMHKVFFNLERMYLFMELISCENESELFTEKLWTFNNKDYDEYEKVLFSFHNSVTRLEQNLYMLRPDEEIAIDFSKPIGWAFKQLVQSVNI